MRYFNGIQFYNFSTESEANLNELYRIGTDFSILKSVFYQRLIL